MSADRHGMTLVEVLVALLVMTSAGLSLVAVVETTQREEAEMRRRERTIIAADRVLSAMTLLTRDDLDRRLGERRIGEFVVTVQRPDAEVYRLSVVGAGQPASELLATLVFRPRPVDR